MAHKKTHRILKILPLSLTFFVTAGILAGCTGYTQTQNPLTTIAQTSHPESSQLAIAPSSTSTLIPTASSATPTRLPSPTPTLTPAPTNTPTPEAAILSGAGDIVSCGTGGAKATAALLGQIPGDIFTAGDNVNDSGLWQEYASCFAHTWGQFLDRIHPSPGNHDYMVPGAANYYQYFGQAAGEPGKGYYTYEEGAWHVVVLNSNCNDVACGELSPQVKWLKEDLASTSAKCVLAYWHHPRFSSGIAGSSGMYPFWKVLYDAGADLVVNGNDHDYERFAPQDPLGNLDPERGIREFVVGTGGAGQRGFKAIQPNSEAHETGTFGVLKLTLYPESYDWEFIPVEGGNFHDSGSGACH